MDCIFGARELGRAAPFLPASTSVLLLVGSWLTDRQTLLPRRATTRLTRASAAQNKAVRIIPQVAGTHRSSRRTIRPRALLTKRARHQMSPNDYANVEFRVTQRTPKLCVNVHAATPDYGRANADTPREPHSETRTPIPLRDTPVQKALRPRRAQRSWRCLTRSTARWRGPGCRTARASRPP